MHTVYVLKDVSGRLYKGMTNDLERRLKEHKRGKTKTTRSMEQLEVIYTEFYQTSEEARLREKYLKTAAGRRFLKKILCTRSSAGYPPD
jgi:putative endonuclease